MTDGRTDRRTDAQTMAKTREAFFSTILDSQKLRMNNCPLPPASMPPATGVIFICNKRSDTTSTQYTVCCRLVWCLCVNQLALSRVDERVARQLLTLSRRIQSYKLQVYTQLHQAVIDSAALEVVLLDCAQAPCYIDLDVGDSARHHQMHDTLLTAGDSCFSHLLRCGITRSHLKRHRRFSVF